MHRLIIDTDPGEDDILAMMMAYYHPNVQIEAITVTAGNVGLANTANNVGVMLDLLKDDTLKVYPGCAAPFVQKHRDASDAHGNDGLGNSGYRSTRKIESTHAAIEIISRATHEPDELTFIALGPMSNLATALKLDPELPHKLKRVVAMAGAVTAHGNINRCSEFNIYADPEAAHVVFEAWGEAGKVIEVADWELTTRNGFTKEVRAEWEALNTDRSKFYTAISAHSNRFIEEVRRRTIQFFADPIAMAVAIEPEIVLKSEQHHLAVEMQGEFTRGQTTVDWLDLYSQTKNADIVLEIDNGRLHELVLQALK